MSERDDVEDLARELMAKKAELAAVSAGFTDMRFTIAALRDENERIRTILEPFARFADQFDNGKWQDHEDQWLYDKHGLNVGDLRRARAALNPKEPT